MIDFRKMTPGTWLKDKYDHYYKVAEFSLGCKTMLCHEMYPVLDNDCLEGDIIALSIGYVKNYTEVYNHGE